MTASAPVRAPLPPPPPAPSFIRPAFGLLAGLGVTVTVSAFGVIVATLAALKGVDPKTFVRPPGFLAVTAAINFAGAFAGGFTTARITAGRSFYSVLLLVAVLVTPLLAQGIKGTPKPGEPAWYSFVLALLVGAGALVGGLMERRRHRNEIGAG